MVGLAGARGCPVHVLLSKCDKLGRNEARETLRRVRAELGEQATAQLFSAVTGEGADEARRVLKAMLAGGRAYAADADAAPLLQPWERPG
jgi:GTP-binding protein